MAREAAREKLRTDVIEMTILAVYRLKALRMRKVGARGVKETGCQECGGWERR